MTNSALHPDPGNGRCFRILCLGEILYDVYPDSQRLGGAPFNFAYHLDRLQQNVAFVSRIGEDDSGRTLIADLHNRGFPTAYIQRDADRPTGRVMVTLDSAGVPSYEIVRDVAYDFIAMDNDIIDYLTDGIDLLYFGTLAQRSDASRQTIQAILADKPAGARAFFDVNLRQRFFSRPVLQSSLEHSDLVKLNEQEFRLIREMFALPEPESDAARELMARFGLESLCITKGERGSVSYAGGHEFRHSRPNAEQVTIVDTLGAGDAFSAIFALGSLLDWPADEVLARASAFATAVCGFRGAIPGKADFYQGYQLTPLDQS